MKDKILKLAKRLHKFTLAEIEPILCCDDLENILAELLVDESLKLYDGIYFYVKKSAQKKELPNFFKFHTQEEIDMIIKCFCADILALKTTLLVELSKTVVSNFYKYFRDEISNEQLIELKEYFDNSLKTPKMRTFYDIPVYFYLYNNRLFVIDKPLKSKFQIEHSKEEKLRIKVLYSRLRRSINHSNMKKLILHHVAEHIRRDGKESEKLKFIIQGLLN